MRVLRFAIAMVPLCLALGVVGVYSQTTPSSQEKPSSQSAASTQSAPSTQTSPSTQSKPSSIWVSKPAPPVPPPPPPKLEHFDLNLVDRTLDPCQDFYQYACSKWNAANPIPPDQVAWGTGSGLQYWNENIVREALEKAAAQTADRTDYEQKIGDYWRPAWMK